jgi:transposase
MVARTPGSFHKAGSTKMTNLTTPTAGIDTAKDKLDMAVHGHSLQLTVENQLTG